jgi:hypothetical protein
MQATVNDPVSRPDLSSGMGRANNIDFEFVSNNFLYNREPEYYVYLYNVSEQNFEVSRPPLMRLANLRGRKTGEQERYVLVGRLPQPMLIPKGNVDSNEIDVLPQDARRFAMDICNPDNLGFNQDAFIDPKNVSNQGNNLGAKGLFWSLNGPDQKPSKYNPNPQEMPTEEEVTKAVKRMENYYKRLLDQARATEISKPADLQNIIGPEHHIAADYFGEEHGWHSKKARTDFCPNCGERIKTGAAFHKTEEGTLCILNWDKAVKAGVRTRQQAFEATEDPKYAPIAPAAPSTQASA